MSMVSFRCEFSPRQAYAVGLGRLFVDSAVGEIW